MADVEAQVKKELESAAHENSGLASGLSLMLVLPE
jgi:hypothetical protein